MPNSNFAKNLRTICNHHRSVADVCRSLQMNRQQFNKYLSGQVYPSRHNLERICSFFKLNEDQLALEESDFDRLATSKFRQNETPGDSIIERTINSLPSDIETLSRYEGFYHGYFHALGFPGYIIRSLLHLYRDGDRFFTKNIEHLWQKGSPKNHHRRFKYRGMAFHLADRIFITEYETLTRHAICHTILFPSYRNSIDTLSGITTGVGSLNSHMPKSTRVEYEYLGKQVDLREVLGRCGLYDVESGEIDADIRERVNNKIMSHEFMLTALDQ